MLQLLNYYHAQELYNNYLSCIFCLDYCVSLILQICCYNITVSLNTNECYKRF